VVVFAERSRKRERERERVLLRLVFSLPARASFGHEMEQRACSPPLLKTQQQQQQQKNKRCCFFTFFSCRRFCVAFAFVLCALTALHEGARRIETMAIAATGEDESVVEYNRILAKAHGTDAPRIFSGGGVVDKAKEARERLGGVVLTMMRGGERRTRTTREDAEESIDGLSTSSSSSNSGGEATKARKQRREKNNEDENEGDDFDEEEESAVNADDPSLLKVELPKSYEKALREDIEKMLRKMPKFTNRTLLTSSGCLKDDAYSSNSNSFGVGGGGVTSANVPKLEIFPNANERSWPGVNTDADFHDGKLDEILGIAASASARNGFFRTEEDKKMNALPTWYARERGGNGFMFDDDDANEFEQMDGVNKDAIGSCARKIAAAKTVEVHKKETVSQRNAAKANDFHDKNSGTGSGDENSESRKVQRLKRIENLANDPWFMFVGDSTTRHQWKTLLNTLREQGYRVAASSVKWKKPADMGKKGVDPSKEALKNRKRDQDVILIDRKNYDNVLVLSLRFLVGNHVAKAAATCADFILNHDYVEDRWPVPEFTSAPDDANSDGEQRQTENEHFGLGDHEAKFATQARSLLRGRMPAGTQPSVIVLNSGLWELPSMIRERQSEFPLKSGGGRRNRGQRLQPKFTEYESEMFYASRLSQLMRVFSPSVCGFSNTLLWRSTFNSQKKHKSNGEYVARFHEHAMCEARKNGVKVIDGYAIHNKLGNPNKMILTAKIPKEDKVHPSDDTQRVVNQAMFSFLCPVKIQ